MGIKSIVRSNWPLLINGFGAASLFFSSILMRLISDDELYSYYARCVVLSSLAFSLAPLGLDLYLCRKAKIQSEGVEISSENLMLIFWCLPLGSLFVSLFGVYIIGFDEEELIWGWVLSLIIGIYLLVFSFGKLVGSLLISQISSSVWKAMMLISIPVFMVTNVEYLKVFVLFLVMSFLIFLISIKHYRRKIFLGGDGVDYKLWFGALVSIFVMSILSQVDRFLISFYLTDLEFSEYFFWGALYMSPLMILSSYFGAKRFSIYKSKAINVSFFLGDLRIVFCFILVSLVISTMLGYGLVKMYPDKVSWPDFYVVLLIVLIVSVRCLYVFLSSLMSAFYDYSWVLKSMLEISLVLFFMFFLIEFLSSDYLFLLVVVFLSWFFRFFQYLNFFLGELKKC